MMYAYTENFVLPLSHDEVVHLKRSLLGKMPGDRWQQLANLRLLLAYQWTLPGQEAALHGRGAGAARRVGFPLAAAVASAGRSGERRRAALARGPEPAVRRESLPASLRVRARRLSVGGGERRPALGVQLPAPRRRAAHARGAELHARAAPELARRACHTWANTARCSTPTPSTTAAATSATSRWSKRTPMPHERPARFRADQPAAAGAR